MVISGETSSWPVTMPAQSSWLFNAWLASRRTVHGAQLLTAFIWVPSRAATTCRNSSSEYSSSDSWLMANPLPTTALRAQDGNVQAARVSPTRRHDERDIESATQRTDVTTVRPRTRRDRCGPG